MAQPNSTPHSVEQNLSSAYVPKAGMPKLPATNQIAESLKKKEAEKTRKDIDTFTEKTKKKFKFVESIGIAPVQSYKMLEQEFEVPESEAKRELIHILTIIPESKFKEINKIKTELIKIAKDVNDKFWIHVVTPVDFWTFGMDSKFDVFEAFAMSLPIYDKNNFLASVRVSSIHKSLVLRKFEKYVTSYVIGGSFVRGETKKTSDIDVVVIIDDTDVKRMSRYELIEKLRGIILSYVGEAMSIAQFKVDFNVQVWLLTDFWERVKDAEPVAFTFIRDGIPLYDKGSFLPWKSLLRMGRIKPSPESVDMFMSSGDKMKENVQRRIFDIVIHDIYWGTIHPTQGLLMLYGLAPQNVYDTAKSFKENFVEKEKLVEKKYYDILEEITLKYYKGFEHGKVKSGDISGKDLDRLFKNATDYVARLKDLRGQIEKRIKEKDIEEIYKNLFDLLAKQLNKKGEQEIITEFESVFVKSGKFPKKYKDDITFIAKVHKESKVEKKKDAKQKSKKKKEENTSLKFRRDVDLARKKAAELTNLLIEYAQRSDFLAMDRARFIIKGKKSTGEAFFLEDTFIVHKNKIQKITSNKLTDASAQDLEKQILNQKNRDNKIDLKSLEVLKKEFGEFELIY